MSYRKERDQFIVRMTTEGLPLDITQSLLRAATTLQRLAELSCSSEAADRDRINCPRKTAEKLHYSTKRIEASVKLARRFPCLCDRPTEGHETIPRIRLQEHRIEERLKATMPEGWMVDFQGDPRGYVLRVIPPSYAERNKGNDRHNLDIIGVPSGPTGLRFYL
jgi:hypothetical protein